MLIYSFLFKLSLGFGLDFDFGLGLSLGLDLGLKLPYILAYRSHHRIGRTMNFVLKKLNLGLTRR